MERQEKGLIGHFSVIRDPRLDRTKKHKLIDIFVIAICGIICGVETWVEIEEWGKLSENWLRKYLDLPYGIPSHDTLGRVFSQLDPDVFKQHFIEWVTEVSVKTDGRVVSIDGKTVRRSFDREKGQKAIHLVNAWCQENQLLLAQEKVSEKSNEITAIPKLLDILDLEGCIITIDAIGCQTEIAKKIIEKKANYVLAVKKNQKELYDDLSPYFENLDMANLEGHYDCYETIEKDHGRIEKRRYCTFINMDWLKQQHPWPGMSSITQVVSERTIRNHTSKETRYYVSSLAVSAKKIGFCIRSHWGVENSCHWVLDVTFNEDASRVRTGHAPENLSLLRKTAMNLLKKESLLSKKSIRLKRLNASKNNDYLAKVIGI